jgi:restriction system protein
MARRRGFFAELQYQGQQAEKRRRQQAAAAYRAQVAAQREAERAQRAADRARAAAAAATAREREQIQREIDGLHLEAQKAEAESRNSRLRQTYDEIDGILVSTLMVDDYVDLGSLKITEVEHPPFDAGVYGVPVEPMPDLAYPPEPVYREPSAPRGMFGGKKKHAELVALAQAEHQRACVQWREQNVLKYNAHVAEARRREEAERDRREHLTAMEAQYQLECRGREAEAKARNDELDKLINDLAFDLEPAVQEYVGIVLSNSVYPDSFPVEHDYVFDLGARELTLTATVPPPSAVPSVKEYKYVRANDKITSTQMSAKAQRDRYAGAVYQVAIRTVHEVFEADRGGKIRSIALTVATDTVSPATGLYETIPLVIVAADRNTFSQYDLENVVPQATLKHLGAAVSKSPFDLTPADTSRGVRVRRP